MRHTCEHCRTRYEISDAKVAGRFVKVRCKSCHGTMHVVGPGLVPDDGGLGADRRSDEGARWWCALRGKPKGPFTAAEVMLFIDLGELSARSRMWSAGMPGWERICESDRLHWAYARIVERLSEEELLLARERTGTWDPFTNAALMSDGQGWFPDPTLKSGIFLLDEGTQARLETLARTGAFKAAAEERTSRNAGDVDVRGERRQLIGAVVAASTGAALAIGGFVWALLGRLA